MNTSSFMGLNTALRGLLANQRALETTGHNISNVNTKGYSRQRVDLAATTPHTQPSFNATMPAQIGTGVEVEQLTRLRDNYIDVTLRNQFGATSSATTYTDALKQIERVINEPSDQGIAAALRNVFGALDQVASNPQDMGARSAFAHAADELARRFNQIDTQIRAVSDQSDARIDQAVTEINNLTTQIASLNTSIRDATYMGMQPNDLLDKRDLLMDELATKINYSYTTDPATQEVTITFATISIVDPTATGGTTPITRADLDTAYTGGTLTSGSVYADEHLVTSVIPAWITRLDDLANSIVTQFNIAHPSGFDLAGNAGGDIFDASGTTAGTITLDPTANILANPSLIAAANSWSMPGEPGNGGNAILMAAMRGATQGAPINSTWEEYYATVVVAGLGTEIQQSQRTLDSATASQEVLESNRQSTSGVAIDEEMTNMLRFQHAYNASARMLTALDESLDIIINRMGRVGL
jgi:flagellar hook-associated protein 1 FlgK